jgi:hypothetical protein
MKVSDKTYSFTNKGMNTQDLNDLVRLNSERKQKKATL